MTWLVFGDDWGRHPSTTQHLAARLGRQERVIWIDSLAMRAPRASAADARRIWDRLRAGMKPSHAADPFWMVRPRPRVLPWHLSAPAAAWNRSVISRAVKDALGGEIPRVLVSNPVAALYLDGIPRSALAYLRLDDYAELPGVDPRLARLAEGRMLELADVVVGTARRLLPPGVPGLYLPQGVDVDHFGRVPLEVPGQKVLGFFGLLAPWIDLELIAAVARAAPEWTLEFVGRTDVDTAALRSLSNVRILPAVPYSALPVVMGRWRAAWAPFRMNELTAAVNPLKIREYLAAGLPTFCTPLPEVQEIRGVGLGRTAADVVAWLEGQFAGDSPVWRAARRHDIAGDSWEARAADLTRCVESIPSRLGRPGPRNAIGGRHAALAAPASEK
jgi:glycosyltransferase involved in cell wall biosynthesis